MRMNTEIRQAQIKKAVLDIINEEGLSALSTRNLARRVGISEAAIFRHFASKKDIFAAILADVKKDLVEELKRISLLPEPAEKRLSLFLCHHVRYLYENRGITILLFSEAAHMNDSALKKQLKEILVQQKNYFQKIVQDGIVEGVFDNSLNIENVATLYMGIPITFNIQMVLDADSKKEDDFCNKMMCLLLRVLKK